MGTSLTGLTPATTYDALIKVGDNGPITASLKTLSDGLGNNLPMEASSTGINFTGTLQQSGTAVPTAAQVNAKQDALVSGTNIKTINGTSVLGSGNIVTPQPSGVSGAIQFSNGSAFASDAANLFWDDTNNRLGIGTNAPTSDITIVRGGGSAYNIANTLFQLKANTINTEVGMVIADNSNLFALIYMGNTVSSNQYIGFKGGTGNTIIRQYGNDNVGIGVTTIPSARTHIVGSGSTSATTSLLVQNSSGSSALTVKDDLSTTFGGGINGNYINMQFTGIYNSEYFSLASGNGSLGSSGLYVGSGGILSSAIIQANSTTAGFLPPRMTTTQKNAISSPAAGLVVYDSTTNKLCCYNGSTWNDLF